MHPSGTLREAVPKIFQYAQRNLFYHITAYICYTVCWKWTRLLDEPYAETEIAFYYYLSRNLMYALPISGYIIIFYWYIGYLHFSLTVCQMKFGIILNQMLSCVYSDMCGIFSL